MLETYSARVPTLLLLSYQAEPLTGPPPVHLYPGAPLSPPTALRRRRRRLPVSVQTSAVCRSLERGRFELAPRVGERPLKAEGFFWHRWIPLLCFHLAARRGTPRSGSAGFQMSMLYSQRTLNNEAQVRYKRCRGSEQTRFKFFKRNTSCTCLSWEKYVIS